MVRTCCEACQRTSACSACSGCSRRAIPFRFRNLRKRLRFRKSRSAAISPSWRGRASSRACGAACGRSQRGQSELGFDLRLRLRGRPQAGDRRAPRPRWSTTARRSRSTRARRAYYLALELRAEARARRRHERAADRRRARRRARRHRPRHRRDAPPPGDVARRRPRRRRAPLDAHQQGLPRRARAEPRARPDGPEPGRGADQAARWLPRASASIGIFDGTKWHRSALLSFVAAGPASTRSSPTRARRPTRSRRGARAASM